MKTIILPKCMMPDGAEPCEGYKQLQAEIDEAWSAGHLSATTEDVELMDAMEAKHKAEIEELVRWATKIINEEIEHGYTSKQTLDEGQELISQA